MTFPNILAKNLKISFIYGPGLSYISRKTNELWPYLFGEITS